MAEKTQLTPEEVFKVAYLHFVMGVEMQALSVAFSVNIGRISEACTVMEYATTHMKDLYRSARSENEGRHG
jgi:hypothetical protein